MSERWGDRQRQTGEKLMRRLVAFLLCLGPAEAMAQTPPRSSVLDALVGFELTDHWMVGGYKDRCGATYRGASMLLNGQPDFTTVVGGKSFLSFGHRLTKTDQTAAGMYKVRLEQTTLTVTGKPYPDGKGFRIDLPAAFYQMLAAGGEMTVSREGAVIVQFTFEPDAKMPERMRNCFSKLRP